MVTKNKQAICDGIGMENKMSLEGPGNGTSILVEGRTRMGKVPGQYVLGMG